MPAADDGPRLRVLRPADLRPDRRPAGHRVVLGSCLPGLDPAFLPTAQRHCGLIGAIRTGRRGLEVVALIASTRDLPEPARSVPGWNGDAAVLVGLVDAVGRPQPDRDLVRLIARRLRRRRLALETVPDLTVPDESGLEAAGFLPVTGAAGTVWRWDARVAVARTAPGRAVRWSWAGWLAAPGPVGRGTGRVADSTTRRVTAGA